MTRAEIGEIVGVHEAAVGRWLKLSKHQLKVNRGGRKPGQSRHLSAQQENMNQQMIVTSLMWLEAVLGFCLGCKIHTLLVWVGILKEEYEACNDIDWEELARRNKEHQEGVYIT